MSKIRNVTDSPKKNMYEEECAMNLMKGFLSFWENCSHGHTMQDSEKNGKSRPIRKIWNVQKHLVANLSIKSDN